MLHPFFLFRHFRKVKVKITLLGGCCWLLGCGVNKDE
jgi:hypothetical protein